MSDQDPTNHSTPEEIDVLADPEETAHLTSVFNSFLAYRRTAHYSITHIRRQSFYALPQAQWNLLATPKFGILSTLDRVDDAIDSNAEIAEACLRSALPSFGFPPWDPADEEKPPWAGSCNPSDQGKAYQTIRQLYRDWSAEGKTERDSCYEPVLAALEAEFDPKVDPSQRGRVKVLVPGAGLGRLLHETVRRGFSAEGNEISYHQVIVSQHVLNHVQRAGQYTLFPWAFGFSNHLSRKDQLASVAVPDIHPGYELLAADRENEIPVAERMSMCSGDFCEVYMREGHRDAFDAVLSVFFIDTAPNPIRYIEAVRNCLKVGGVWINLGPLLWHFEHNPPPGQRRGSDEVEGESGVLHATSGSQSSFSLGIGAAGSVELTDEEMGALLEEYGFKIERHEVGMAETGYIQNPSSLLQSTYRPVFWVARKVR